MSYLHNDPADFAEESADGFVLAHRGVVRRVEGGVARATRTPPGQVAVVIGGGSGHYPAFAGLVGPGFAHGAAMGNVFASPSAQQIHAVATAVAGDAGVLLTYGNYAGDVLNFDQAEARLVDEGVPCRSVPVTDDIASAAADERSRRRGIAGDFAVFRIAAWAAEQGMDLDAVAALARRANEATRTLGVAFSGTTLPGADAPLFTVPPGRMAVGMGIHGEPGIEELPMPTADELAHLFVERLLGDLPDHVPEPRGGRVVPILNGLGSVKSEELFVVYVTVAALLADAGVEVVQPEVGEFATSFEMAGVSLTLLWLDEEFERAWASPAAAPAYRKGALEAGDEPLLPDETATAAGAEEAVPPGSPASRAAAPLVVAALGAVRDLIDRDADELGRLDAVAGDGDHGIGMQRGSSAGAEAARAAATAGAGAGTVLTSAGDAWADRAGGTSGALWGAALRAMGTALGDQDVPAAADVVRAVTAADEAVRRFGKAEVGDKTMVDVLVPFARTLRSRVAAGAPLLDAWTAASDEADAAARATADLVPRLGRARPHADRSLGTQDPGAVSLARALAAVGVVLAGREAHASSAEEQPGPA